MVTVPATDDINDIDDTFNSSFSSSSPAIILDFDTDFADSALNNISVNMQGGDEEKSVDQKKKGSRKDSDQKDQGKDVAAADLDLRPIPFQQQNVVDAEISVTGSSALMEALQAQVAGQNLRPLSSTLLLQQQARRPSAPSFGHHPGSSLFSALPQPNHLPFSVGGGDSQTVPDNLLGKLDASTTMSSRRSSGSSSSSQDKKLAASGDSKQRRRKGSKSNSPAAPLAELPPVDMNLPFPVKLHYILSSEAYPDAVWLSHGRAFRIVNPKRFEERVIPVFFRSAKLASFMRQLNGWAFTRMTSGPDMNAYYHGVSQEFSTGFACPVLHKRKIIENLTLSLHPFLQPQMFLRGIPALCARMKRPPKTPLAAAEARNTAGATEGIPNFYRINQFAPLPANIAWLPDSTKDMFSGPTGQLASPAVIVDRDTLLDESNFSSWPPSSSTATAAKAISSSPGARADNTMNLMEWDTDVEGAQGDGQQNEKDVDGQVKDGKDHGVPTSSPLSKADIAYLAHQNKNLLRYAAAATPDTPADDDRMPPGPVNDVSFRSAEGDFSYRSTEPGDFNFEIPPSASESGTTANRDD